MDINQAKYEDLPEILAVQKLAFYDVAKFYNNFKLGPLQVTISDLENTFSDYKYLKMVVDNNIVGSVRTKAEDTKCKVENMIIHPKFQNKGLGKKLMQYLERNYLDCSFFELYTGKDTPKNVSFYQKQGYEIIDEIQATMTEPILVIMRKTRKIT